jgi:hypothetical protein
LPHWIASRNYDHRDIAQADILALSLQELKAVEARHDQVEKYGVGMSTMEHV